MRATSLLPLILLLLLPFVTMAQKSKAQLEREKQQNEAKIQEANRILKETRQEKTVTMGQLNALNQRITASQDLVNSINAEVRYLDDELGSLNVLISSLQNDLEALKKEYATMVYAAAKSNDNFSRMLFLFSATDFNQLLMRMKYLEQYATARKVQVEQIQLVQEALSEQNNELKRTRDEKQQLLQSQRLEADKLIVLKEEQRAMVQQLAKKEKQLSREVKEREKRNQNIEKLITELIKREIRKTAAGRKNNTVTLTPEAALVSKNFAGNRRKLIWPVEHGFISMRFGKQSHPVLRGVQIENLGISIQTNQGETVRSVFDGEVMTVASMSGEVVVFIQHGEYFTVYRKLKDVSVTTGQKVSRKDPIGTVYTDRDGTSEIQFQIWKNFDKLNPAEWLYMKR